MSENAGPAVEQAFAGFGCQDAVEWVEKLNLFWIDDFFRNFSNCLIYNRLHYIQAYMRVNPKIHITTRIYKKLRVFFANKHF